MKVHDSLIGGLLIVFGLWVLTTAQGYPQMPGQSIGPGTFPSLLGALFLGGGALLVISKLRARGERLIQVAPGWRYPARFVAAMLATIGVAALAFVFETVGFPLGGFVLLTALFILSGYRRPIWILTSAVFVLAVHLTMTRLLYVPLPAGLLKGIL